MKSSIVSVAALAALASAAPASKRQMAYTPSAPTAWPSDTLILQYATFLELLEYDFYVQGLGQFNEAQFKATGAPAGTFDRLVTVKNNEGAHRDTLVSVLTGAGSKAPAACKYKFPFTDAKSFLALAGTLEGVGANAYLFAEQYIMNPVYRKTANSISQIEAAHNSYVRTIQNQEAVAQPFYGGLSFNLVYTLASAFVVPGSCPGDNPQFPFKPFPSLNTNLTGPVNVNDKVMLATVGNSVMASPIYAAFLTLTGSISAPVTQVTGGYNITIPKGVAGQSYVVLTKCQNLSSDDDILAGPAIVEIAGNIFAQ